MFYDLVVKHLKHKKARLVSQELGVQRGLVPDMELGATAEVKTD